MKFANWIITTVLTVSVASASWGADAEEGETLYLEYCATCHGLALDGQGPMAGAMLMKPADLTVLTAQNGGVFPLRRVVDRIDGRDPLVAQGSPMPVYGHFFEGRGARLKAEDGDAIVTSRNIADLVAYVETVQK